MKRIYALFVAVSVVCSLYADIPAGIYISCDYDENTEFEIETLSGNEAALVDCETTAEHIAIPSVVQVEYEGSEYNLTVKAIGKPNDPCYVFNSCEFLRSVEIPNSVEIIGDNAFWSCDSLTSVEIPASVKIIADHAFHECVSLTSVEIPNGVDSIGEYAFLHCTSLTSIHIPASVTNIGHSVFAYCPLETITVDKRNPYYDSRAGCNAVIKTSTHELVAGCKNSIILNSVKSIGEYAFDGCRSLKSVEIPNSVESIGRCAFNGCNSLKTVKIGNGLKSIGFHTFTSSCPAIESVYCAALTPPVISSCFSYYFGERNVAGGWLEQPMPTTLYVPEEAIDRYKDAEGWGKGDCGENIDYPYGQRCNYFQIIKPMPGGTGTEDVREDDGFAVYVRDGVIYVEETEEEVEVYDVTGRKVYDGEKGAIPVGRPGVYIVRSGENVEKVVAG